MHYEEMASTRAVRGSEVASADLPSAWRNGAVVLAITASITLAALLVAAQAGMELEFDRVDGRNARVRPGIGVLTLVLAVLAGTTLLATVGRRSEKAWKGVAWAGLLLSLLSTAAPLSSSAGAGVTALLVSLHVLAGVTWFVVLMRAVRQTRSNDLQDR